MLLPTRCPLCRRPGPVPCAACRLRLRRPPPLPPPPGLARVDAALAYDDSARRLVTDLKYRGVRAGVPWLGAAMAAAVGARCGALPFDAVTWAPTSSRRRRHRGYDQAQLLAGVVAHELALPLVSLLRRDPGPGQTGRALAERRAGPSFRPRAKTRVPPFVLVVDDVCTSGATLEAAAAALRAGGAECVHAVVAARRLLKAGPQGVDALRRAVPLQR